jgi:transcriptional regulator with XRE-family HTH domain
MQFDIEKQMNYTTDHIATTLKNARKAKGLSQRALSELVRAPQSHISKIESGGVDLRVSSLVELARVLDLELAGIRSQHGSLERLWP